MGKDLKVRELRVNVQALESKARRGVFWLCLLEEELELSLKEKGFPPRAIWMDDRTAPEVEAALQWLIESRLWEPGAKDTTKPTELKRFKKGRLYGVELNVMVRCGSVGRQIQVS